MTEKYFVYAAGDMKSGWQDVLRSVLSPRFLIKDPRSHGLAEPDAYTKWGLDAIKDSVAVIAYMGPHNPSGYGLSLEVGFAHALGRKIIFIDEMGVDWRSPYFGMVRSVANAIVPTMDHAARAVEEMFPT